MSDPIKDLTFAQLPWGNVWVDVIYILVIINYVFLTFLTTAVQQAKKRDDKTYCLSMFTEADKNLFVAATGGHLSLLILVPFLILMTNYYTSGRIAKLATAVGSTRLRDASPQLLTKFKGTMTTSTTKTVLTVLSIVTVIAVVSVPYFILGFTEIKENTNEGESGYCLHFKSDSDYGALQFFIGIHWLILVLITLAVVRL